MFQESFSEPTIERQIDLGLIDAVTLWCETLQGRRSVTEGLRQVAAALGAEVAVLSRLVPQSEMMPRLVVHDPLPHGAGRRVQRSFARDVLGDYATRARAGSMWQGSVVNDRPEPELARFQQARGFQDVVLVMLAREAHQVDFLELHFRAAPAPRAIGTLTMMADTLSRIWMGRVPGVFAQGQLSDRVQRTQATIDAPILDTRNPNQLSRAEFRVCLMISRGLSDEAIMEELSITGSTLRTHLRNVYGKTGAQNRAALMHRLLVRDFGIERRKGAA
ncbi:helix-turn-helix transcriptional regulator [Frigidibacter sp. MR17.14]|uniref:helix-turn-helix transcriptional regulator n=1 Tax=Frigidibacter sp. MR17.14 TaxID=3126509 RepID=UPI003012DA74